ncbi:ribosome maturation factor RimM [Polymorphobacter sp.]|uniref:ribosome maturation factor RimM n=1 Tax=Polymorphobacter sp. TaxID=1909290 RepID=UPI003F6FD66D
MSADQTADITLAAVAGAHGIGGAVRLKIFAQGLESLQAHRNFSAGGKALTLTELRPDKIGAVARFAEIHDRNQAEALRGTLLTIPREALPPLEDGEYYHADIIGRPVEGPDGAVLGTVLKIENYGAGDILELTLADGRTTMVPFRAPAVSETEGRLVVDPLWLA